MNVNIGIIGGSGVYKIEGIEIIEEHEVSTPFGKPSDKVTKARLDGHEFYFIPRHGRNHTYTPSEVNYCANIYALKTIGVDTVISISAVGSLKEELPPASIVLPDQFIDWTKGLRRRTFFGQGVVGHVSTANPIEKSLQKRLANACAKADVPHSVGGSYICIEGPQFSSKAESNIYRNHFGASVIGMTNVPEAYLAKEAGMAYATCAMVTDYDCWKEEHCTVEEIMKTMATNNQYAHKILKVVIPDLYKNPIEITKENTNAIMTPTSLFPEGAEDFVNVLLK